MITHYSDNLNHDVEQTLAFVDSEYVMVDDHQQVSGRDTISVIHRMVFSEFNLSSKQIKSQISRQRQNYQLIAVEPKTAKLASFAARDGRTDIIKITPKLGLKIFNTRYSRRLVENEKFVEIDLDFFFKKKFAGELRQLLRILKTFENSDLRYFLTNNPTQPTQICSYRGLQSLARLLNLSNAQTDPRHILSRVERNQKKIDGKIPFPGVEIHGSKN